MSEHVDKVVYFVRHGQSEQNVGNVFQGGDAKLTELGERQARFVAERMAHIVADIVLASPMPRAHVTAQYVAAATGLPLETHPLFREYVPPSELTGRSHDTPEGAAYIQLMLDRMGDPDWHHSDEENYFDLHARACEALAHLEAREEARIIVVSHAGFMRALLVAMLTEGEPDPLLALRLIRCLKPSNTGVTVCHYQATATTRSPWRLVTWNDHAHLAEADLSLPEREV